MEISEINALIKAKKVQLTKSIISKLKFRKDKNFISLNRKYTNEIQEYIKSIGAEIIYFEREVPHPYKKGTIIKKNFETIKIADEIRYNDNVCIDGFILQNNEIKVTDEISEVSFDFFTMEELDIILKIVTKIF